MSKRELMQIQLDQLRWENRQLQEENAKLRDHDGREDSLASVPQVEAELAKCLEEQQQLEREIRTRSKLLGGEHKRKSKSDRPLSAAEVDTADNEAHELSRGVRKPKPTVPSYKRTYEQLVRTASYSVFALGSVRERSGRKGNKDGLPNWQGWRQDWNSSKWQV